MLTLVYIQCLSFNLLGVEVAVRLDDDPHEGVSSPVWGRVEALLS